MAKNIQDNPQIPLDISAFPFKKAPQTSPVDIYKLLLSSEWLTTPKISYTSAQNALFCPMASQHRQKEGSP